MKKLLLATTAAGFIAASAQAGTPTIKLGGYADYQLGIAWQDNAFAGLNNVSKGQLPGGNGGNNVLSRGFNTATDTQLYVDVEGETDFGLKYGAHITLNSDVNTPAGQNSVNGNLNAGKTYLFGETQFGRVEGGATTSSAYAMQVGAETLARGTGGIAGDFERYIDLDGNSRGGATRTFFAKPGLANDVNPLDVAANSEQLRQTANKISYMSPRMYGFMAGVSYTPDTSERGTENGFGSQFQGAGAGLGADSHFENLVDFGVHYKNQFEGVGVTAAATGQIGSAKDGFNVAPGGVLVPATNNRDDLQSFNFGLNVSYMGFELGGSYGLSPELGRTKLQGANVNMGTEASYWTLGGAYVFGPFGASVTYLQSTIKDETLNPANGRRVDSDFQNLVFSADYQLAPGLVPYAEVSLFDTDDNVAGTVDNDGTVFLSGISLTF